MSRLRIVHTTTFHYADSVTASFNEARMTPASDAGQTVIDASLVVTPHTWRHDYVDYWGSADSLYSMTSSLPSPQRSAC